MSLSRFKGALVGAVIGDCIGSEFEGNFTVKMADVLKFCEKIKKSYKEEKRGYLKFTDDTAMARSVMKSLQGRKEFDAVDMATRFSEQFFLEPNRGYGSGVITVFQALSEPGIDVYQPALEQFNGSGSYGNGGAMRIAPASLFAFHLNNPSFLANLTKKITSLTHTHHHGIQGAILQALAVDKSLRVTSADSLDCDEFCDGLISIMTRIEGDGEQPTPPKKLVLTPKRELDADPSPYCAKLNKIKEFVKLDNLSAEVVEKTLGNDISALGSVPAAVLAFLRGSTKTIENLEEDNPFKRVILYAISLGGDTDTIATMAGAMAGALHGIESIPEDWRYCCEGTQDAEEAAKFFFEETESKIKHK